MRSANNVPIFHVVTLIPEYLVKKFTRKELTTRSNTRSALASPSHFEIQMTLDEVALGAS